jgi:hypothetical protein
VFPTRIVLLGSQVHSEIRLIIIALLKTATKAFQYQNNENYGTSNLFSRSGGFCYDSAYNLYFPFGIWKYDVCEQLMFAQPVAE